MFDHVFYRDLKKVYPIADRAEGIYIYDIEGKRYIDGSGGACVVSIGHGVPEIIKAMTKQAKKVAYVHGSQFTTKAAMTFAERITSITPSKELNRVYFVSGGSEAVETSLKLARQYWEELGENQKFKVISRWGSYHGASMGALALGGHTSRRKHFQPLIMHTPHIFPCYCYRCPFGKHPKTCDLECAESLERTIKYEGPESISAFMAEPVLGATAGAVVPKDGYWQRIREICDKYNILLIVDEVMVGIGRTGKNFAIEHWDVIPDIIVTAKGLSSGYTPVGAVITKQKIHDAVRDKSGQFVHGYTYSQNPLSMAVGAEVLKYIKDKKLVERSEKMGKYLLKKLNELKNLSFVGDIRGIGLFAGIEFVQNKKNKEPFNPDVRFSQRVANEAFRTGLITYPGSGGVDGVKGDHILICPPFIITEEQIDEMIEILRNAIKRVSKIFK